MFRDVPCFIDGQNSGGRTKAEWKSFELVTCSLPNEAKELLGKTCEPGQKDKRLLNLYICHKISWQKQRL